MMSFLYNIIITIARLFLQIIALFNKKISLFINGRKDTFQKLSNEISSNDKTIWIHCASLGEFEQGRPIIERIKNKYKTHKIILTFFSPSGYEVQKNYEQADVVCYLPLDTRSNALKFIEMTHPEIAIFVKYEFWPNILKELRKNKIETILVSGVFRNDQIFFKSYGVWMRKSLQSFSRFFVQDENSKNLLESIDIKNVTISGDTRFDRVNKINLQDNTLNFVAKFKQDKITLVAGSTWKEDEEALVNYINKEASENEKFIFAPHNIKEQGIKRLYDSINKKTVLYSEKENQNIEDFQVLILDTIGILTRVYSYADIAYVGGGFETGLHNVLEPATFGVPILIGPKYQKFNEAVDLVHNGGCIVVENYDEMKTQLRRLFSDTELRKEKGSISKKYIKDNIGATETVLEYISTKIKMNGV